MIEYGQFYRQFEPLYWVNTILNRVQGLKSDENFLVTDVRFPNEANAIKKMGGLLIRLERHSSRDGMVSEEIKKNISETALDNYTGFDFILPGDKNKTPNDLVEFWIKIRNNIENKI